MCVIDGCNREVIARGWCTKHYQRWKNGIDMNGRFDDPDWCFWQKVNKDGNSHPTLGPCWEWTGYVAEHGYGKFARDGVKLYAHRIAYEMKVGPIPEGLELDHLCRVRHCVNPGHLEPVPHVVNTLRGVSPAAVNAQKTACVNGHEFTPENTIFVPHSSRKRPARVCRTCKNQRNREWARRRAEVRRESA